MVTILEPFVDENQPKPIVTILATQQCRLYETQEHIYTTGELSLLKIVNKGVVSYTLRIVKHEEESPHSVDIRNISNPSIIQKYILPEQGNYVPRIKFKYSNLDEHVAYCYITTHPYELQPPLTDITFTFEVPYPVWTGNKE